MCQRYLHCAIAFCLAKILTCYTFENELHNFCSQIEIWYLLFFNNSGNSVADRCAGTSCFYSKFLRKTTFFLFDTVLTKKRWSSGGKSIGIFAINRLILAINRSRFRIVCTHHHDNDPSTDVPRFRNMLVQMVITVMLMFISRNKCQWLDFPVSLYNFAVVL